MISPLEVRTKEAVDSLIAELMRDGYDWNYVGGVPNNSGAINIYPNSGIALIERITNAFDGVIEREMFARGGGAFRSPHEAITSLFDIKDHKILPSHDKQFSSLAKKVVLTLSDTGEKLEPTVEVRDQGIGIHPDDAEKTILGLHGNNKRGKFHLHGMFGQGGSGTFAHCHSSIIMMRRLPESLKGEQEDFAGFTVVMQTHEDEEQLPSYKYLAKGGKIARINGQGLIPPGVIVRHVNYRLAQWGKRPAYDSNGLISHLQSRMFDPAMPLTLVSRRKLDMNQGKEFSRYVRGIPSRLQKSEYLLEEDKFVVHLPGKGSVTCRWWVVAPPKEKKQNIRKTRESFIPQKSNPIALTNSGHVLDSLSARWFRDTVGMGVLSDGIIIDIDIGKLDHKKKASLVGGNRGIVKNNLYDDILEHVVSRLRSDTRLREIDEELRARRISTAVTDEKLREKLSRMIETRLKGALQTRLITGSEGEDTGGRLSEEKGEVPQEELPEVPTRVITPDGGVLVRQGGSCSFSIDIDAKNGLFDKDGHGLELVWRSDSEGVSTSNGSLKNGKVGVHIKAGPGAPLGERELTVRLTLADRKLESSFQISVLPAQKPSPKRVKIPAKGAQKGPEMSWVFEKDWVEYGWHKDKIGTVEFEEKRTTILLNRDADVAKHYIDADSSSTSTTIARRENEWWLKIGYGVFKTYYNERRVGESLEGEKRLSEAQIDRQLLVLAESVSFSASDDW